MEGFEGFFYGAIAAVTETAPGYADVVVGFL